MQNENGLYTLNNSSCGKAASEIIPMSLHQYVIRVIECSQRTCSLKYDGHNCIKRQINQTATRARNILMQKGLALITKADLK